MLITIKQYVGKLTYTKVRKNCDMKGVCDVNGRFM